MTPLTPEQREAAARSLPNMAKYVTLEHGTERAFTGSTVDGTPHSSKQRGVWVCALGGLPLFTTDTKVSEEFCQRRWPTVCRVHGAHRRSPLTTWCARAV